MKPYTHCLVVIALMAVGAPGLTVGQVQPEVREISLSVTPVQPSANGFRHRLLASGFKFQTGNAALSYYRAFQLCEFDDPALTLASHPLRDLRADELDSIRTLMETRSVQRALEYAEAASQYKQCDWGTPTDSDDPFSFVLFYVDGARQLARLIALQAKLQIADGQIDQAIATLRQGFTLAHHVANSPLLVQRLIGQAIAQLTSQPLTDLIAHPDCPSLYWSITELPDPFVDFLPALEYENNALFAMFPELRLENLTWTRTDDPKRRIQEKIYWERTLQRIVTRMFSLTAVIVAEGEAVQPENELQLQLNRKLNSAQTMRKVRKGLAEFGLPQQEVEALPDSYAILKYSVLVYRQLTYDHQKWLHVPFWQGWRTIGKLPESLSKNEVIPLGCTLMVAVESIWLRQVQLQRDQDMLRIVDALRLYAATNDGALPSELDDLQRVPIPRNPLTGSAFRYRLEDETAILESMYPADPDPVRFKITIRQRQAQPSSSP